MTPGRAANAAGWYNAPLSVTFAGTDPMSGVASCVQPPEVLGPGQRHGVSLGELQRPGRERPG